MEPRRAGMVHKFLACGLVGVMIFLLGAKPPPDTNPEDMKPPGDCEDAEYARLNAAVDRACNDKANPVRACDKENDSCDVLSAKIKQLELCIAAREARENKCFRGGDDGHKKQIRERKTSLKNCNDYHFKKCIQGKCPE